MYVEEIIGESRREIVFGNFLDENILQIPIVVVVFGSVASLVLLIVILILVSNRTRGKISILLDNKKEQRNSFLFSSTMESMYNSNDYYRHY